MSKPQKKNDPPEWPGFASALRDLLAWQADEGIALALIGGIAVSAHSRPRATKDIDVTVATATAPTALLPSLSAFHFELAYAESVELAVESGVLPLRHTPTGVIVDIIFARLPYQEQVVARALPLKVMGLLVPVALLEDLCVMKLFAARPVDIEDVRNLIRANPSLDKASVLEQVRLFADLIEEPEIFTVARTLLAPDTPEP